MFGKIRWQQAFCDRVRNKNMAVFIQFAAQVGQGRGVIRHLGFLDRFNVKSNVMTCRGHVVIGGRA